MVTDYYRSFTGKRLLNNIYDATGVLLISKDTILLESHIEKLANFNIRTDEIQAVANNSSGANNAVPEPV
ncbi:hypothetical protein [Paenibacillus tengchongensis]|uniref:hypothetical protein n=1 Tax=Paenibacillus tengchongensis TaxID=2608684 RepID=UPI00124C51AF|nr:hypothetical protein [Paenibacillus tengchongensis]